MMGTRGQAGSIRLVVKVPDAGLKISDVVTTRPVGSNSTKNEHGSIRQQRSCMPCAWL